MRRHPLRVFFALAALALVVGFGLAAVALLRPPGPAPEVFLASVEQVTDIPLLLQIPEAKELSAIARLRRGSATTGGGLSAVDPRALYLIRDEGGGVRAFLAADPRNGCALEWRDSRFHDICHGSMYDRNGTVTGGPSPWALDEAIVSVRGGRVFVRTRDVRPGACLNCEASRFAPSECDLRGMVRSVGSEWTFSIVPTQAGRPEFIGHVYRGPFGLSAHPDVRFVVGGKEVMRPGSIAEAVAVGDTVCLKFRTQVTGSDPIAFWNYVLTEVVVQK